MQQYRVSATIVNLVDDRIDPGDEIIVSWYSGTDGMQAVAAMASAASNYGPDSPTRTIAVNMTITDPSVEVVQPEPEQPAEDTPENQ